MKKLNKKGFTLAELLIVVAIIAVLVAISIPVFSAQLEKSREAVDAANLRAAYAEIMTSVVSGDNPITTKEVTQKQTESSWKTTYDFPSDLDVANPTGKTGKWTLTWDATDKKVVAEYTAG